MATSHNRSRCILKLANKESLTLVQRVFCKLHDLEPYQRVDFRKLPWKQPPTWTTAASDTEDEPSLVPLKMQEYLLKFLVLDSHGYSVGWVRVNLRAKCTVHSCHSLLANCRDTSSFPMENPFSNLVTSNGSDAQQHWFLKMRILYRLLHVWISQVLS
jgi:hypothetical protein